MRLLIEEVGLDYVAARMMSVEYFGYQSLKWRPFHVVLPSQSFAFQLVSEAIAARKTVIVARSRKLWEAAVRNRELRLHRTAQSAESLSHAQQHGRRRVLTRG